MGVQAFNFITTKNKVITIPANDIVMATQLGSNIQVNKLGKSNYIFTNGIEDLLLDDGMFPATINGYICAINLKHVEVCQKSSDPLKTDIFFKSNTGLSKVVSDNSQEEILQLMNSTVDQLGGALFTDGTYMSDNPFTLVQNVEAILPNDVSTKFNVAAPDYALNWMDNQGIVRPDNGDLDLYIARPNFLANPDGNNRFLEMKLDIGGTQNVIWSRTITLPRGSGVDSEITETIVFFAGSTFFANGGSIKLTANTGNIDITNISCLVQKLRKV